jgi:hypothetical protein
VEFDLFDKVLPCFVERRWQLCIAGPDSEGFITSDHPVALMWSDGSPSTMQRPVGFGLEGTTVLFPLTRNLLMVGVFGGGEGERNLAPLQVAIFNSMIAQRAERQVYGAGPRVQVALDEVIGLADLPGCLSTAAQRRRREPEDEPESDASNPPDEGS